MTFFSLFLSFSSPSGNDPIEAALRYLKEVKNNSGQVSKDEIIGNLEGFLLKARTSMQGAKEGEWGKEEEREGKRWKGAIFSQFFSFLFLFLFLIDPSIPINRWPIEVFSLSFSLSFPSFSSLSLLF